MNKKFTAFAVAATFFMSANPARAQQAPAPQADTTNNDGLQTVVVTAQRRSESIQEIPYSISAVSGTDLENRHIDGLEDITRAVPGVSFGAGGNAGMESITMRGVSSVGGGATVGQYLDDVPIITQTSFEPPAPTSGAAAPKLFDLDRIEILRGPQGTLYGSNSMGGAIRYITKAPDLQQFTVSTTEDVSYTQHGGINYDTNAVINAPIVPGVFAIRAGVDVGELSGYIDRYAQIPLTEAEATDGNYLAEPGALINSHVNTDRNIAARVTATWMATDQLTIQPMIVAQRMNTGDIDAFYPGLGMYVQDALEPQPSKDTMVAPSLTVKDALGAGELTSVTSYFLRSNDHESDGTYFNSDFIQYLADTAPDLSYCQCGVAFTALGSPSYSTEKTRVLTEEVRFSSNLPKSGDLPLSYIAGLFISDRRTRTTEYDYIPGIRQTFLDLYGLPPQDTSFADPMTNDLIGYNVGNESQKQYALYGELTYYPTDALKITAGLRGAHAETGFNFATGGYFAQGIAPLTVASGSSNAATPKLAANYDFSTNVTAYATTSEGYRIGGYIVPIDLTTGLCPGSLAAFGITNPKFSYEPDRLWNYELGAKTNWLDNHVTVNADVYYIDWKDVQQTFALSCGTEYTANFGDAASYGTELEIQAKPIQGWTVGLNAGTTHATLTDVVPNVGATDGQHLLNTPAWTANLNTEYDWFLGEVQPFIRADYSLVGPSHGSYNVDDAAYNYPRYAITNGSTGFNHGNLSASLYVKNLFNDQTIIQRVSIELLEQAYVPRPRTVGVQFSAKF